MMWLLATAWAGVVSVGNGELVTVPIDASAGLMIELPGWVRVVTPSKSLEVDPVKQGGENGGVKHLQLSLNKGVSEEDVSFSLSDGRVVSLRLVSAKKADRYLAVRFEEEVSSDDVGFLSAERALLASMFQDDPIRRTVLNERVTFEEYPELQFQALRKHWAPGLVGYTFEVVNVSGGPLQLHPEVLSLGYPNRASLVQVDHHHLIDCEGVEGLKMGSEEVLTCRTVLRVVAVAGAGGLSGGSPVLTSSSSAAPFAVVKQKTKSKRGKK